MPRPPIIDDHVETIAKKFQRLRSESKESLYFGLELEVERFDEIDKQKEIIIAKQLKKFNEYLHIKRDGSITNGFEFTDQPQTLNYFYNHLYNWQKIFDILCKYEYYEDNAAGFHIHINANYLTVEQIAKLYYFVHSQKAMFTKIGRRSGGYHYEYKRIRKVDFDKDELGVGYCRNEALNLTNMETRGTIEFRLFRSTIDIKLFIATVEFIDLLIHFIKDIHSDVIINKLDAYYCFIGYYLKKFHKYNCLEYLLKDVIEC